MTAYGVHTGLQHTTVEELRSLWQHIEQLGFDWISIWDHFYAADTTGDPSCLEAVAAHAALGKLEETRYGSDFALASLDTLYGERADAVALGKASGGVAEIAAARDAVSAIVAGQNGRMEALRGILVSP